MKIGIDYRPAAAAPWSGIGRQVLAMTRVLASSPEDQLLRYSGGVAEGMDAWPALPPVSCPARRQPVDGMHRPQERLPFEARFLPFALDRDGVEAYIATANRGLPWLLRRPSYRRVLLLHDLFQWDQTEIQARPLKALAYRMIERVSLSTSLRSADVIWAPSRYTMNEAAQRFPMLQQRLRWLPNCVPPLPSFRPGQRPEVLSTLPVRYWLTVGTRGARKNIERLLTAWTGLRTQGAAVPDLVLVGQREDLPAGLRDWPGLHLIGGVDDKALGAIYQAAECLWHPAWAEGFGLPVVEALAAGTAVAVARGTALDEVTPDDAPRFDPHDTAAITQLMLQLGKTPAGGSRRARQAFAARFAPEAYARHLLGLIAELRT